MVTNDSDEKVEAAGPANGEPARSRMAVEDLTARLEEINDRIKSFIRERPAACLLGALAVGYLVARAARRTR